MAAAALVWQTGLLFNLPFDYTLEHSLLLFSATFLFYCLSDYSSIKAPVANHTSVGRMAFWQQYGTRMRVPMVLMTCLFIFLLLKATGKAQVIAMVLAGITALLYSFTILPGLNTKRIKDFALLKLLILAIVWTIATTLLVQPFAQWLTIESLLHFFCRCCFMLVLCIPFDVRDDAADSTTMQKTLLQWINTTGLSKLCFLLLVLFAAGFACLWYLQFIPFIIAVAFCAHMIFATWLAVSSVRKPGRETQYLWLDAQMIIQSIIVGGCWSLL